MKESTIKVLIVLIIIGFLVNIGVFQFSNKTEGTDNPYHYDDETDLISNIDISGSSGRLFTGEKIRNFNGKLDFFFNRKLSTQRHKSCKTWGVVTTIFELSDSIKKVGNLANSKPTWCLVIVLDKNSKNKNEYEKFSSDRVVILDVEKQEEMAKENEFIQNLPWNHFARKNLGYYYAIQQGAEIIFDFDDDNLLYDEGAIDEIFNNKSVLEVLEPSLEYESSVFNPYPMMQSTIKPIWARGFPLDEIKKSNQVFQETKNVQLETKKIGIIQSLANHDPDVDSIYRLTQPIPFDFNLNQKSVLVPQKSLTPFNAQATIWTKETFWGLLLPSTVHGRVSDIWRSYIVGRILRNDPNIRILFSKPLVVQKRNPHNYLKDFQAELPLYLKSGALVAFLQNFKFKKVEWYDRYEELIIELYERDFIEIEDVKLYHLWIQESLDLNIKKSNNENDPICLYKPFCWKEEFDWENTDPPANWICNQKKNLKFYDLNLHDGVMMDHSNLIEHSLNHVSKTKHQVFHWNYKNSKPASGRSIHPLKNSPIPTLYLRKTANYQYAEEIWNSFHNHSHFLDVDALIFGYLPSDFQWFLQFNKSIIIDAAHRINLYRCTINETLNTFKTLQNMANSVIPKHVIGAHYLYDVEYIRHYTGISAILLPATQLDSIDAKYTGTNELILVNSHIKPKDLIQTLKGSFDLIFSDYLGHHSYKFISQMKAVIYLPYSISNYKFIDHYAMQIPIFSPSPRFAIELHLYDDRTMAGSGNYYCSQMTPFIPHFENSPYTANPQLSVSLNSSYFEDELFWIKLAEIYNLPCIILFDSWLELFEKLKTSNFDEISRCMNQSNKWRKFEAMQNWCFASKIISGSNGKIPEIRPKFIKEEQGEQIFMIQ